MGLNAIGLILLLFFISCAIVFSFLSVVILSLVRLLELSGFFLSRSAQDISLSQAIQNV